MDTMRMSEESPQRVDSWKPFEYYLTWLERIHTLLEACGGLRQEDQLVLGSLTRGLLTVAAGEPLVEVETPPVVVDPATAQTSPETKRLSRSPRRQPAPTTEANGHPAPAPEPVYWSLNERLRELGYPEDLDRSTRVRVGQAAVLAYRDTHGKAPKVSQTGSGAHAKRVSLYAQADLPLVDGVLCRERGEPPAARRRRAPDE
jgi:hypothetical protein